MKLKDNNLSKSFLIQINQNTGILHKVSKIYFDGKEDREDVIQEMMYQLWHSFSTFNGNSKFSTWMYRVCINTALTYNRKNRKKIVITVPNIPDTIEVLDNDSLEESIVILMHCISKLTKLNKAIILLFFENLTYEEIASITGLSKSNVSVRLVRIKREIENNFNKSKGTDEEV
ncbi:MAG: sigma-70 family RNA polymerase sigma factor [Flavobacterium sp.]|uniref:sigma-70 family RNA polymerase sigma factor n=1 Tax=Flavobacterium sp. TaxID=239 RepID=UPI003266D879